MKIRPGGLSIGVRQTSAVGSTSQLSPTGTQMAENARICQSSCGGTALAHGVVHMPVTIWKNTHRRCTVTVTGVVIAVQLMDGERLLQERIVASADQALNLAEVWAEVWKANDPALPRPATRRPRQAAPRPASQPQGGTVATPRVVWIDRG